MATDATEKKQTAREVGLHPHSSDVVHNVLFDLFLAGSVSSMANPQIRFQGTSWLSATSRKEPSGHQHVLHVTDIPGYLEVKPKTGLTDWVIKEVPQYKGYAADLRGIKDIDDYLNRQFSAKRRSALRGKIRKLERECAIRTSFFCGEISDAQYLEHMQGFYQLLSQRFDQKRTFNRNLLYRQDYYRIFKPLIRSGKACLMVMEDGHQAISYSIAFCHKAIMFGFMQTFDPAYAHYNLGDVAMYRKLERSLELGVTWYDFSKGDNRFKDKWCNQTYTLDYWVCHRKEHLPAAVKAHISITLLRLRQWLRDIGFLGKRFQMDRFLYKRRTRQLEGFRWEDGLPGSGPATPKKEV